MLLKDEMCNDKLEAHKENESLKARITKIEDDLKGANFVIGNHT
jgi:hypothetical protein